MLNFSRKVPLRLGLIIKCYICLYADVFEFSLSIHSLSCLIERRLAQSNQLISYNTRQPYFTNGQYGRVDDDHKPFLQRGKTFICSVILPSDMISEICYQSHGIHRLRF